MRLLQTALASLVVVGLLICASQVDAQKKKKGKRKGVSGRVTKVDIKDGEGTITVKTGRKKGKKKAAAKEHTFKVNSSTKVYIRKERKGKPDAGTLSDIKVKQRVFVFSAKDSDTANRVVINMVKRKKKKADN